MAAAITSAIDRTLDVLQLPQPVSLSLSSEQNPFKGRFVPIKRIDPRDRLKKMTPIPVDEFLTPETVINNTFAQLKGKQLAEPQKENFEIQETQCTDRKKIRGRCPEIKRKHKYSHHSRSRSPKKREDSSRSRSPGSDRRYERRSHHSYSTYSKSSSHESSSYSSRLSSKKADRPKPAAAILTEIGPDVIRATRFSQMSIDYGITSRGTNLHTIDALIQNIASSGWNKDFPIDIVRMPDGIFTSLDNRRLFALKSIIPSNSSLYATANVHNFDDPSDQSKIAQIRSRSDGMTEQDWERVLKKTDEIAEHAGIQKDTYGHLVLIRMHAMNQSQLNFLTAPSQFGGLSLQPPQPIDFGYTNPPVIMDNTMKKRQISFGLFYSAGQGHS